MIQFLKVKFKGQGEGWAKGQIHLNSYNFRSSCYRDFKLGSYLSLWKAASNMTFNLTKGQGQDREKGQIKRSNSRIGYNFRSNCYRDFKLGSYFSLWKAASNMTFNLTKGQGQDWEKGQIHLIGYNFRSNCHRDFKLGSCFSL